MGEKILELRGIEKSFPGVKALTDANLELYSGEVVGLCGENGAGKSTLIKMISGVYQPDSGKIFIDGKEVSIPTPQRGMELGVSVIYQELSLAKDLDVAQNLFLGNLPKKNGLIDYKKLYSDSKDILKTLGMEGIDPHNTRIGDLNISNQQLVEIGKAIARHAKILIMDEPTSSLDEEATQRLFKLIKKFRDEGYGIIYISHHMDELFQVADRVVVLRDGMVVESRPIQDWTVDEIVFAMVNRTLGDTYPEKHNQIGEVVLKLDHVSSSAIHDVSLELHRGEVLGLAGIVGAGRSEVLKTIYGVYPATEGTITVNGEQKTIKSPAQAMKAGIGMLFEDRRIEGLILIDSVEENIALPHYDKLAKKGIVSLKKKKEIAEQGVKEYNIKTPGIEYPIGKLSGGNQQKALFARVTYGQPGIYLLDEPTRGIDVSVKKEMYLRIAELTQAGNAVILVTSELPELIGMADRVLVMRRQTVVGEVTGEDINQETIMSYATGGRE